MVLLKEFKKFFEEMKASEWQTRQVAEESLAKIKKATRAYKINATGDVCTGDQVLFPLRIWEKQAINRYGKMANVVTGYELIEAKVVKESYGEEKQQHTFILLLSDGAKKLIKGRNLYGCGVWRKEWKDESLRRATLEEKHNRGYLARKARSARLNKKSFFY
ncbi:MAG: hypothetical protein RBR08_14575 [Desulforegulaceae bacterium]|nr:hypothetical protein [Desulforegulaceae bacterium]